MTCFASGAEDAGLRAIMVSLEHLLGGEELDLPNRFVHHARLAKRALRSACLLPKPVGSATISPSSRPSPSSSAGPGAEDTGEADSDDVDVGLRQVISDAITAPEVIDIYAQPGIERPDVSIIDDEFAKRFTTAQRPDRAVALDPRERDEEGPSPKLHRRGGRRVKALTAATRWRGRKPRRPTFPGPQMPCWAAGVRAQSRPRCGNG